MKHKVASLSCLSETVSVLPKNLFTAHTERPIGIVIIQMVFPPNGAKLVASKIRTLPSEEASVMKKTEKLASKIHFVVVMFSDSQR